MTAERVERLEPYLNPPQVNELLSERKAIEDALSAPAYVRNQVQDMTAMRKHAQRIEHTLQNDVPKPYDERELDRAARREQELREDIIGAMPTQAEMRRCPAGAIDKERSFQRRNKAKILEWKNLRRRLHASGMIDDHPDAREVANLEQFRPAYASHELNMDNTVVQGKSFFMPNGPIAIRNVMSDEDRAAMDERAIKLAADAAVAAYQRLEAEKAGAVQADAKKPAGKSAN